MRLVCPPTQEEEALETLVRVVAAAAGADDACSLCSSPSLSLTQVAIAAQLSHQIILTSARVFRSGLTDRLPGTIIVELKWHWKGAFGVKGEFNSFQLSKPTTFCKCLISIMTPQLLALWGPPPSLPAYPFLYLRPLEWSLGTFVTWLCLDSGLGGNEVETLAFVCSCVCLCLFSCQTAHVLVFPYPPSLPCPINLLLPPASVSALNLSLAVIALPTVFKSH